MQESCHLIFHEQEKSHGQEKPEMKVLDRRWKRGYAC